MKQKNILQTHSSQQKKTDNNNASKSLISNKKKISESFNILRNKKKLENLYINVSI